MYWIIRTATALPIPGCGFLLGLCLFFCSLNRSSRAGDDFERAPIHYYDAIANDPVAKLMRRIERGEAKLEADQSGSYLRSLLRELDIPVSSQCLVFSKTSLQINHISPRTPRAIYFNDNVYVGAVLGSSTIEIASMDPELGCVFYTLESSTRSDDNSSSQDEAEPFRLIRDRGQCLSCHATTRTERVPGVLVRSIFSDRSGRARSETSNYVTDSRSPFLERWGGWYVTGTHGDMRHMGNVFAVSKDDPQTIDRDAGANRTDLPSIVDPSRYLGSESDLVSLMVMEHQTRIHNLITRANFETRMAIYLDQSMNEALQRPADYRSDSTIRRIAAAGDALVEALLLCDEFCLTSPVSGTSTFTQEYASRGPKDSQGRSLYQLDLNSRLFRFGCSPLILSEQFDALPQPMKDYVQTRIAQILSAEIPLPNQCQKTPADLQVLKEILAEIKPTIRATHE